jgi:hypothetical protein
MKLLGRKVANFIDAEKFIILDTNIIINSSYLNNLDGKIFTNGLRRTYEEEIKKQTAGSAPPDKYLFLPFILSIPEVVEIETRKHFHKNVREKLKNATDAIKSVNNLTGSYYEIKLPQVDYGQPLESIYDLSIPVKLKQLDLESAVVRAIEEVPPVDSKKDFLDSLIWFSALTHIGDEKEIWFVTKDKDFLKYEKELKQEFENVVQNKTGNHYSCTFKLFKDLGEINSKLNFTTPMDEVVDIEELESILFKGLSEQAYFDDILSLTEFHLKSVKIKSVYRSIVDNSTFVVRYSGIAQGMGMGMRPWDLIGGLDFRFNGIASYDSNTKNFVSFENVSGDVEETTGSYPTKHLQNVRITV